MPRLRQKWRGIRKTTKLSQQGGLGPLAAMASMVLALMQLNPLLGSLHQWQRKDVNRLFQFANIFGPWLPHYKPGNRCQTIDISEYPPLVQMQMEITKRNRHTHGKIHTSSHFHPVFWRWSSGKCSPSTKPERWYIWTTWGNQDIWMFPSGV